SYNRVSHFRLLNRLPSLSSAWVRPYKCCSCILKYLRSKLANLGVRLANVCSPLFFVEGLSREPRLVSSLRITLNLPQAAHVGPAGCRSFFHLAGKRSLTARCMTIKNRLVYTIPPDSRF